MIAKLIHIPLNNAWLCLDCSVIGNSHCWCPCCASGNLMSLATVLDRKEEKKANEQVQS